MAHPDFLIKDITVTPLRISMYVPPVVWKGDRFGHIGEHDTFFWILEGECYLNIDSQYYVAHPGQMVYLPKGKMRSYSHASSTFSMYEMAFSASVNGQNLMEALNLTTSNFVVDILQRDEMSLLFERSSHVEIRKNPLYDLGWCANIVNIIRLYAEAHQKQNSETTDRFAPVFDYMAENLQSPISISALAELIHMQPTYFTHRFRDAYGVPPVAYLGRLRVHKAMELLVSTDRSIDEIGCSVGFQDAAYFSRFFKKHCGVTPSEYRRVFRQE
mgnify:CR=1 FL=1